MSKSINQTRTNISMQVEEVRVIPLRKMLMKDFGFTGISQFTKGALVDFALKANIVGATVVLEVVGDAKSVRYEPVFKDITRSVNLKKAKTTEEALSILDKMDATVVSEIVKSMSKGVSLLTIVKSPEKYVSTRYIYTVKQFAAAYDVSKVKVPTRTMSLVYATELLGASFGVVDGARKGVIVQPRLEYRAQNHMSDALSKTKVFTTRNEVTGDIEVVSADKAKELKLNDIKVDCVDDLRSILSIDYNLPILTGEKKLTREQVFLQTSAITNGVYFMFEGKMVCAEYFMASPSQKRTVMGTHIVGLDAVESLHELGMDFRQFAKQNGHQYVLDMIKAPTRFGLALTSSVRSRLVTIGNQIEEYKNGDYAIIGGNHTMLCVNDIYSYVQTGKYLAYNPETDSFIEFDASKVPFKRNVTDGMIFADASVQLAFAAEFGKLVAGEQVRITPATKGLVVFVPGLKDMCGHDLLAFESATKGNYKTLLTTNPDYEIQVRIAIFGHNAIDDKKKTNVPYQMIQTNFSHKQIKELCSNLDAELDEMFQVYDSPEKLAKYLGTKSLEIFQDLTEDELSDEQREHVDGTLVSMFAKFFYLGDFVMEDPYFKKRLLDIIENMIRAWTRGSMPIDGHYRFCVTDVYGVMEAFKMARYALEFGYKSEFLEIDEKGNATNIVPPHIGIPANHVVMVDDNDEYFVDGKDIIFNRNPKISTKETGKATGIITRDYFKARQLYPFAFNNLIFYSCHDFVGIKQGGLDFDGDKSHASMSKLLVDSYRDLPALLDLSYINGKFIEGCPFPLKGSPEAKTKAEFNFFGSKYRKDVIVDGVQFNDEFVVTFTDADYTMDFARQLHELSKVFVLRSMEPNKIGDLTNYATAILSAISRLEWSLVNGVDVDSQPLTDDVRKEYEMEINKMEIMVDKLRLLQGWEIDKPKHGGAFWDALKTQLLFITDSKSYPKYASIDVPTRNGKTVRKYAPLEWKKAVRSSRSLEVQPNSEVYPSIMQELRAHVVMGFTSKIKARFNQLNPADDKNNLIYRLAPHANVTDYGIVEAVTKMLVPIFKEYGQSQVEIMNVRTRFTEQREDFGKKCGFNKFAMIQFDRQMKHKVDTLMDNAITSAQSKVKALPFDEATIAYIAYAKKYIEYRPSKAASPASGLSFPWVICRDGMLELISRASGKSKSLVKFNEVKPAPVEIRIKGFEMVGMAATNVATLFESGQRAAIWYKMDEETLNYLPYVYVGKTCVGVLVFESAYYFTGSEKFAFTYSNFKMSATGKSASLVLDDVKRF